jgi:hypothetical protein
LNQTFTFNGQNKTLTIKMVLKNKSAAPLSDVVLRRVVDFDVDAAGPDGWTATQNWHTKTYPDSVSAWSDAEDAQNAGKEAHGMVLRHLTQPGGVSHYPGVLTF